LVFDVALSAGRKMRVSIKREVSIAIAFSLTFATVAFGVTVAIVSWFAH
jgi:hypothetical protein